MLANAVMKNSEVTTRRMPTVSTVFEDLPSYQIVYSACHRFADASSPSQSGLLLCGDEIGTAQPLIVELAAKKDTTLSQIAYFSACSIVETTSLKLLDEEIYVVSRF